MSIRYIRKIKNKKNYCIAKCNKENPFEMVETQEFVQTCSISERVQELCKINYVSPDDKNKER